MAEPKESSDNYIVTQDELINAKKVLSDVDKVNLEKHVKYNGCLIKCDAQKGVGTCIEKGMLKRILSDEFIQKYNPERLSHEEYRAAYEKGELHWQNQDGS